MAANNDKNSNCIAVGPVVFVNVISMLTKQTVTQVINENYEEILYQNLNKNSKYGIIEVT